MVAAPEPLGIASGNKTQMNNNPNIISAVSVSSELDLQNWVHNVASNAR